MAETALANYRPTSGSGTVAELLTAPMWFFFNLETESEVFWNSLCARGEGLREVKVSPYSW
eukprot:9265233-Pyramimonas_sp.AAC.1